MHPQSEPPASERRIDPAHPTAPSPVSGPAAAYLGDEHPIPQFLEAALATNHVEDLIPRLQRWATDLDAREARLNARQATLDHHERAFRMWSQAERQELREQQRAAEQRREQLEREVRALALQQWTPGWRSDAPAPPTHAGLAGTPSPTPPQGSSAQQKRLAARQPSVIPPPAAGYPPAHKKAQ